MSDFFNFGVQSLLVGSTAPYSGPFESSGISSIEGVQSATFSLNWPRQDILIWDGNGSAENITRPTAQLDFSYLFSPEFNLNELGLAYNYTGLTNPALSSLNYEKNYYLVANMNGQDMIGYSGDNNRILALGNGLVNQFSFNSAVGQPNTVSMSVEGLNLLIQTDRLNQYLPSVSKANGSAVTEIYSLPVASRQINEYFSASPSAIVLSFNTGLSFGANISGVNEIPLDSFSFSINLNRDATKSMGWAYPESRSVQWPVTVSASAKGTLNNLQADYLNRYLCDTGMSFNVGFKTGCGLLSPVFFDFQGAKLDSESITSAVGNYTTIDLNWSLKIFDINRKYPNFYIKSVGQNSYSSFSSYLPQWNIETPPFPGYYSGDWSAVAFGNNLYVAGKNSGGTGSMARSSNSPVTGIYYSVIFPQIDAGTGLPVTINFDSGSYISNPSGYAVINANEVYLPQNLAQTGAIRISGQFSNNYNDIIFEKNVTSPSLLDGIPGSNTTWTISETPSTSQIFDIAFGNGIFVAIITPSSGTNRVMTSTDGITWTIRTTPNRAFRAITYGNNQFVAVGTAGAVMTSTNGITWVDRTVGGFTTGLNSVVYGNNLYVAASTLGVGYAYSIDGITWTNISVSSPVAADITYGNGIFVTVGESGQISRSTNGISWLMFVGPNTNNYSSVTFGNGFFYAVSSTASARVIRSTDGLNWTTEELPQSISLKAITYGAAIPFFVTVGTDTFADRTSIVNYTISKKCYLEVCSGAASIINGNTIFVYDRQTPIVIKVIPEDGSNIEYISL